MSIGSIGSYPYPWYWQNEATQSASGSTTSAATTADTTSASIDNAGSVAAAGSMSSFFQSFAADLQAMLVQAAGTTSATDATQAATATAQTTTDASGTSADATSQTASNQAAGSAHHHHHHHGGGANGAAQGTAAQLVDEIGQSLQSGSLTAAGISSAANSFASDVMQALQSYGTVTPATTDPIALA